MMFKKKPMVDVAELQRKGLIINNRAELPPTNRQGFIDMSKKEKKKMEETITVPAQSSSSGSGGGFFGFMDSSSSSSSNSFSTETNGYDKREVDRRIEALDNKLYKLEQRIELLERKANVSPY
jgi:hypothetical protein